MKENSINYCIST